MTAAAITVAMVASLAPPPAYDFDPPFAHYVADAPAHTLERLCPSPKGQTLGCAFPELGLVYVLEGLRPEVRDLIVRHELAHLNGWSKHHD